MDTGSKMAHQFAVNKHTDLTYSKDGGTLLLPRKKILASGSIIDQIRIIIFTIIKTNEEIKILFRKIFPISIIYLYDSHVTT
jgi:hypothetical protein